MKNPNSPLLKSLAGKTVEKVVAHTSHGEVLEIVFTDGTSLGVCTTYGLMDKSVKEDPDDIHVTVNDERV